MKNLIQYILNKSVKLLTLIENYNNILVVFITDFKLYRLYK